VRARPAAVWAFALSLVLVTGCTGAPDSGPGTSAEPTAAVSATVPAPEIVGLSTQKAISVLSAAGLQLGPTEYEHDASPSGTVFAQQPAPGVDLPKGSSVVVAISKGPLAPAVPNVIGASAEAAAATLKAAGYAVRRVDQPGPVKKGLVMAQMPAGGLAVQPGTVVEITVSKGAAK